MFEVQLDNLLKNNLKFCNELFKDSLNEGTDKDFVDNNFRYVYLEEIENDVIVQFTNDDNEILYVRLCGRYVDKYYGKKFTHYTFTAKVNKDITTYVDYNI